ncbi:Alpha-ketoglutarate permease [Budvicia aquatica]|uniref:Alpha-ketoglutarate permease n=1 Tax=Budvicia aquatica TaxID=82979 RepID=A0A484ZDE2_9GAMM|nr:Alpha-ketoglutarate permease [Budvicia aquatica]
MQSSRSRQWLLGKRTVATYISLYYYGTFSAKYLHIEQVYAHASMLLAGVLTFSGALLVGALSDRVGRKKLIIISRLAVLVLAYPSFWLLVNHPHPAVLLLIVFVMVSFTTLGAVPAMLVISELFPKRIRALGFALVYSIGVAIFGGFAQFFCHSVHCLAGQRSDSPGLVSRRSHSALNAGTPVL